MELLSFLCYYYFYVLSSVAVFCFVTQGSEYSEDSEGSEDSEDSEDYDFFVFEFSFVMF